MGTDSPRCWLRRVHPTEGERTLVATDPNPVRTRGRGDRLVSRVDLDTDLRVREPVRDAPRVDLAGRDLVPCVLVEDPDPAHSEDTDPEERGDAFDRALHWGRSSPPRRP